MDHDATSRHLAATSPHPLGLHIVRAEGCHLYTSDGAKYLDLIAGLAVNNLGHGHPKVLKALHEQADRYLHVIPYGEFQQDPQIQFADTLIAQLPHGLDCVYFVNSGTEAVEASLKLAKRLTGRTELIGFEKSYHGSTHGSLSVTGNESKRFRNRPLLPDAHCIPFNDLSALELITERTAAVIVEPVQGDAGVRIPSPQWMFALKNRCTDTGAQLIFDEVQTGFGRTGKRFAFEHFDVVPDILVLGKALGGGLPMGAFISSRDKMESLTHDPILGHITTFGGHPLSCTTGKVAFDVLIEEELHLRAEEIGESFEKKLQHPKVKEIRRLGAMLAVQLENADRVQQVVHGALQEGVLGFWFLSCPDAFRIAPPLTISHELIGEGCAVLLRQFDALQ